MDLKELLNQVNEININDRQCTQAMLQEWKDTLPLFKKKILINCHFTIATLILVELFLFSGAEIKITCTEDLVCHDSIKEIIENLGIYLAPSDVYQEPYTYYFDVILDCGAYLAESMRPKNGFIELTYVDDSKYQSTHCPIISVDSGLIKKIETTYGTGDGFVRAISTIYAQDGVDFKNKKYMIFGYGKVGQGITSCLVDAGVSKTHITIIETCTKRKKSARHTGFAAFSITESDAIKALLLQTHCAVTATGVINSVSNHLQHDDFHAVEYLANMGTHDEWGHKFPTAAILHNKRPLNFILDYPTKICYLDPIFAVLACATLDIINQEQKQHFNIQKPLANTEKKVLNIWLQHSKVPLHQEMKEQWLNELEYRTLTN